MANKEPLTLEEKVDKILKYQTRLHHLAVFKAVLSFLIFLILVVLPVFGFYYLSDYIQKKAGMSFTQMEETLMNGGWENLKKFIK